MKRPAVVALIALLTFSVFLLTACGGPSPSAEPTPAPAQPTEMVMPTLDPATQAPPASAQPAGSTDTAPAAARVQITLVDNTITSPQTEFKAGVPYIFIIMNKGRHEHNFNIAPPVALAGGYPEALAQALLAVDETQIPPGSSFSAQFTFPQSAVGADLEFSCLIRRHYEDGMRLAITVTN